MVHILENLHSHLQAEFDLALGEVDANKEYCSKERENIEIAIILTSITNLHDLNATYGEDLSQFSEKLRSY